MHLVLLNSKYTLNKKKIINDDLANKSNECDSLISLESLCEDTELKPKDNLSHLEFARPDPNNLSLLSTRTTLKVKSPAGFTAAFKRPAFEFEETLSAKPNQTQMSAPPQNPSLIPFSGLKNMFCCFR